jgi:hypothetical protein
MRAKRVSGALAALLLLLAAHVARSQDRPLRTEPATTAAAGTVVFETGLDVIADEPSYVTGFERNRWEGPLLRAVYSPADNVELDLEWLARVGVWNEPGRVVQGSDWGDVTLRAKWRVVAGQGGRPTLGARFFVTLPETKFEDKQFRPLGLGPNTIRFAVEGLLTKPFGPLQLDLDLGLLLFDEVLRAHEQRDFLSYGVALAWRLEPAWQLVAEVAGRAGDGMPGSDQSSEARLGVRLGRGRLRYDLALRRGLLPADGTWGATAGLSWTVRERP